MPQATSGRSARGRRLRFTIILSVAAAAAVSLYLGRALRSSQADPSLDRAGAMRRIGADRLVTPGEGTLQGAIDAARNGETILVGPGTWRERIDLRGKNISLRGLEGSSRTRLESDGRPGAIVTIRAADSVSPRLEGFTIVGGRGAEGSGVRIEGCPASIIECRMVGNEGGGAVVIDSHASFESCRFQGNRAIPFGGGLRSIDSEPILVECAFDGNAAQTGGGAIYARGGAPMLIRTTFDRNRTISGAWGGGIFGEGADVHLLDSQFSFNNSESLGGAIFLAGGSAEVEHCAFQGNVAEKAWSIFSDGAKAHVVASRFCGERKFNLGGDGVDERDSEFAKGCFNDCNNNGIPDELEIARGWVTDCDGSGVPDSCKLDCNNNGIPDICEIAQGWARDCNNNGIIDSCEIEWGLAEDNNHNWILDECEKADAAAAKAGDGSSTAAPSAPSIDTHKPTAPRAAPTPPPDDPSSGGSGSAGTFGDRRGRGHGRGPRGS